MTPLALFFKRVLEHLGVIVGLMIGVIIGWAILVFLVVGGGTP